MDRCGVVRPDRLPAVSQANASADLPVVAVGVAAGLGLRFGGPVPKQVRTITGKALVALSVEALAAGGCTHAVLVISDGALHHFSATLATAPIPVRVTAGGPTRQASVLNGLQAIADDPELSKARVVLVHDAVRPLVPANVVRSVIDAVEDGAVAVTPVVPVVDTIRMMLSDSSELVDRSTLRAVQTPQGFDFDVLYASHQALAQSQTAVTDDVTCCEYNGHPVVLVEGSRLAMKITEPADLEIAKALAKVQRGVGSHTGKRLRRHLPEAVHKLRHRGQS